MAWYRSWKLTKGCVKAIGGKTKPYAHYCPLPDFEVIVQTILELHERNDAVTRPQVLQEMDGRRLKGGRVFRPDSHEYKINIVFFVLEDSGILRRATAVAGRSGVTYSLTGAPRRVRDWLKDFVSG